MNELCHTCQTKVALHQLAHLPHTQMSHVTHHVTHVNESSHTSCHIIEWVMSYIQMIRWFASHTCQWVRFTLRWGWVFLETTRILSGIQFTTHFIEFSVVETERFVGSFVNVILTRQTCGQRSSRAAESKHRALGNYFCERICYMFLQPVPWKMRLEMVKEIQIKILNGGEILVN